MENIPHRKREIIPAGKMESFRGIHYPQPFFGLDWPSWFYWLWRKLFCWQEKHLWSECYSPVGGFEDDKHGFGCHYLVCDACQLMAEIKYFEITYSRKYGIKELDLPNEEEDDHGKS